jgi:hypothetical protein
MLMGLHVRAITHWSGEGGEGYQIVMDETASQIRENLGKRLGFGKNSGLPRDENPKYQDDDDMSYTAISNLTSENKDFWKIHRGTGFLACGVAD